MLNFDPITDREYLVFSEHVCGKLATKLLEKQELLGIRLSISYHTLASYDDGLSDDEQVMMQDILT